MINISGFGTKVQIVALQSFPVGFTVESFTDDADALTIEDVEPVGYQLQYDGGVCFYDKSAIVKVSLSVIPNTVDDINLKLLLQARKGGFKWLPIQDITSMLVSYPDGGKVAFSNGSIISGPLGDSVVQSGRRKSNTCHFAFAAFGGAQSRRQTIQSIAQGILGAL